MFENKNTGIMIYQTEDGRTKVDVRLEDETVWMTQKAIAELYQKGVNTINEHIKSIIKHLDKRECLRRFNVIKKEGSRKVERKLLYYNLDVIFNIAIRGQYFEEFNSLNEFARANGVEKEFLMFVPIKERYFGELLKSTLNGIVDILPQYVIGKYIVDFYIPEINLIIEYDEKHHLKQIVEDKAREQYIKEKMKAKFIRVNEGEELHGLNHVIMYLLEKREMMQVN